MINKTIQAFVKLVILFCLILGSYLVYNSKNESAKLKKKMQIEHNSPKALTLKKFLLGFKKPERVEIYSYTKRFENDVNQILEMKIPTDPNSNFYVTIQFFSDEGDETAPLVAQVRFLDSKSKNVMKEQSINLE